MLKTIALIILSSISSYSIADKNIKHQNKTQKISNKKVIGGKANDKNMIKCEQFVYGTDQMRYVDENDNQVKEIVANKACSKFTIKLRYKGNYPSSAMGHNIVLTKTKDIQAVSTSAIKRGPTKGYLPTANDPRVLASSKKLLGGGPGDYKQEDIVVELKKLKKNDKLSFWCSFPGHISIMKGVFKVIESSPTTQKTKKMEEQKNKI